MFKQVEESQTLLINTQTKNLISQKKEVIKFGFGQSPFLPPVSVMNALKEAVHHKEYSSVQGDLALRKNIARFHEAHNGLQVTAENIVIAPGSKILLYNILLAFDKADVFIPTPSWVSYAPQAKLAGHHSIPLPTTFEDRWRITSKTLKIAVKNKKHQASILILNYPGNPDGLTYSEAELKDLANTARSLNMLVIADEIYGLLDHEHAHKSFANYYPERTITTTGLSKWCGAGGWRLGAALLYDAIEPEFKQALLGIASETYSCAPTPVQIAARKAYEKYEAMVPYLSHQTAILKKVGAYCAERLCAAGIRVHPPQGAFYLFPDFSSHKEKLHQHGIKSANELCGRLLQQTGVALLPASAFGFTDNYLAARLAYVDFKEPNKNHDFMLSADCPMIIEGINRICQWLTSLD